MSKIMGATVKDPVTFGEGIEGCAYSYASTDLRAAYLGWSPWADVASGLPTDYRELPGIADAAWISPGHDKSWTAMTRVGDRLLSVTVHEAESSDVAIAVLKAALAKP